MRSLVARRLVPFALMLGLTACAPPVLERAPTPLAASAPPAMRAAVTDAHAAKSVRRMRPRLLSGTLSAEALSPAIAIQSLDDGLYAIEPTAALRSAGLRQLSAQHVVEGHPQAAVAAARGAHALAVEAYGPDHIEALGALIVLSDALAAAGRITEAETVLLLVARRMDGTFAPEHPTRAAATQRLAVHRSLVPLGPLLRSFNRRANRRS